MSWKALEFDQNTSEFDQNASEKAPRFSSPSFQFWVWCEMENSGLDNLRA